MSTLFTETYRFLVAHTAPCRQMADQQVPAICPTLPSQSWDFKCGCPLPLTAFYTAVVDWAQVFTLSSKQLANGAFSQPRNKTKQNTKENRKPSWKFLVVWCQHKFPKNRTYSFVNYLINNIKTPFQIQVVTIPRKRRRHRSNQRMESSQITYRVIQRSIKSCRRRNI